MKYHLKIHMKKLLYYSGIKEETLLNKVSNRLRERKIYAYICGGFFLNTLNQYFIH